MKTNESQCIITPRLLLVPYSAHHVPTYHTWMQNEEIQAATASEPLTLEEEYAMQRSWRSDGDKLTFIVCAHDGALYTDTHAEDGVKAGTQDAPSCMIGDVNLFLFDADDDEEETQGKGEEDGGMEKRHVLGELEIMIASPSHRHRGFAQETLRAFMGYVASHLSALGAEYAGPGGVEMRYLRVKIGEGNADSVRLFERLGFVGTGEVNYFGEVELRRGIEGVGKEEWGRVVRYQGSESE